jgi:hypothetical protein
MSNSHRNNSKQHHQPQSSTGYQNQQFSPKEAKNHQKSLEDHDDHESAPSLPTQSHHMGYYHGMPTQPETPKYVRESLLLSNRKLLPLLLQP